MKFLDRFRNAALPAALTIALAGVAWSAWALYGRLHDRRVVQDLMANRDVTPQPGASADVLFARGYYLFIRDRIDEGQGYAQPIADQGARLLLGRFYYDLGNARLRRAIAQVEASKIDAAIPEVRLAKAAYRSALLADPELWDARYNLDVAMRLVRDFPELERGDEEAQGQPKKLWTDLPGLPRGLP
ncbi:hypothetical protein [Hansschlegelia sp.]|uniref:hypothetical protein n=1 Tax=Hansschlegelia sp. TaxID=2041892 RepID=UPI002C06CD6F|nr:hypothetical protein [Hansschlegelia sp.]HVI28686.1 hypothetical protein [Hansschlegelia sp.]